MDAFQQLQKQLDEGVNECLTNIESVLKSDMHPHTKLRLITHIGARYLPNNDCEIKGLELKLTSVLASH